MNYKQALQTSVAQLFVMYAKYCENHEIKPTKQGFYVWANNQMEVN